MKTLQITLLASVLFTGCVGTFSDSNIEARYQKGLHNCIKERIMSVAGCERYMADVRAYDYDYRLSLRRVFSGGAGGDRPIQVYHVN
jgi:hypothetical protein